MERNSLDDQLKKQLGTYKASVDIEALWSTIEPELPPEQKKRRFLLWFFIPSLMLLIAFGLTKDNIDLTFGHSTHKLEATTKKTSEAIERNITHTTIDEQRLPPEPTLIVVPKPTPKNKDKTPINSALRNKTVAFLPLKKLNINQIPTAVKPDINDYFLLPPTLPKLTFLLSTTQQLTNSSIAPLPNKLSKPSFSSIIRPVKKGGRSRWDVTLDQMVGIPKSFYRTNRPILQNQTHIKQESENPLWITSSNLTVGFRAFNQLRIRTGISMSWIYEEFSHTYTADSTITQSLPTSFFVNAPQDTTFFRENIPLQKSISQDITHYNQYTSLQIPIGLSYQFELIGQKFELGAGTLLHIFSEQKGKTLDLSGQVVRLEEVVDRQEFLLGYYTDFGVILNPNKRMNYLIQVQSTYQTSRFNSLEGQINKINFSFGLKTGLRFRF